MPPNVIALHMAERAAEVQWAEGHGAVGMGAWGWGRNGG